MRDLKEEKAAQEKEKVKHYTIMMHTLMSIKEEVDSALHAKYFDEEQIRVKSFSVSSGSSS